MRMAEEKAEIKTKIGEEEVKTDPTTIIQIVGLIAQMSLYIKTMFQLIIR
jgi:hypothetical protein